MTNNNKPQKSNLPQTSPCQTPKASRATEIMDTLKDETKSAFIEWATEAVKKSIPKACDYLCKKAKETAISLKEKHERRKIYQQSYQEGFSLGKKNYFNAINQASVSLGIHDKIKEYLLVHSPDLIVRIIPKSWNLVYSMPAEDAIEEALFRGIQHGVETEKQYITEQLEKSGIDRETILQLNDKTTRLLLSEKEILAGIKHKLIKP